VICSQRDSTSRKGIRPCNLILIANNLNQKLSDLNFVHKLSLNVVYRVGICTSLPAQKWKPGSHFLQSWKPGPQMVETQILFC